MATNSPNTSGGSVSNLIPLPSSLLVSAVQQGLDIPENLDDLVLSEDEKEVSNKQDITNSPEEATFVETEEAVQTADATHTETEEKPGSQA